MDGAPGRQTILVLGGDGSQGRAVLDGLRRHVEVHRLPWLVTADVPPSLLPELLTTERSFLGGCPRPDAVAGFIRDEVPAAALRARPLPVVSCSVRTPDLPGLVRVPLDDAAIGATAARYCHRRGFRQAGFYGAANAVRDRRHRAFAETCAHLGIPCARFTGAGDPGVDIADRFRAWVDAHRHGGTLAVFCHQDGDAVFVRRLCLAGSLAVPREVAILGVDDDRAACCGEDPQLSSVVVPWWEVGAVVARTVHAALSGHPPATVPPVGPMGVASRASTTRRVVADPVIERALRLLERHPERDWNGESIAAAVGLSRRGLQDRWRRAGGGFAAALCDRRLDAAEELLRSGDLGVAAVATRVGFKSRQAFFAAFRRRNGRGPAAWRRGPAA